MPRHRGAMELHGVDVAAMLQRTLDYSDEYGGRHRLRSPGVLVHFQRGLRLLRKYKRCGTKCGHPLYSERCYRLRNPRNETIHADDRPCRAWFLVGGMSRLKFSLTPMWRRSGGHMMFKDELGVMAHPGNGE
jgi:hypothetical protein